MVNTAMEVQTVRLPDILPNARDLPSPNKPKPCPSLDASTWAPPLPGAQAQELLGLFNTLGMESASSHPISNRPLSSRPSSSRPPSSRRPASSRPLASSHGAGSALACLGALGHPNPVSEPTAPKASTQRASSARLFKGEGPTRATSGPRRAASARSYIGAKRVVQDGQSVLILDTSMDGTPNTNGTTGNVKIPLDPRAALVVEIRKDAERAARQKKEAAERLRSQLSLDGMVSRQLKERAQTVGAVRRALDSKLEDLRKHPHEVELLQERVARYAEEASKNRKDLIEVNRERVEEFAPEKRLEACYEQQRLREERLNLATERRTALELERHDKFVHLAEKHVLLKERLQQEREADEAHLQQQHKDAKIMSISALAARFRVLSFWLQTDRLERKYELHRQKCAARIQRWWRFRLRIIRRKRSQARAIQVCMRWKVFVARQKRWRIVLSNNLHAWLVSVRAKTDVLERCKAFHGSVNTLQRFLRACHHRLVSMTLVIEMSYHNYESEFLEKRAVILEELETLSRAAATEEPSQEDAPTRSNQGKSLKPPKGGGKGASRRNLPEQPAVDKGVAKALKAAEADLAKSIFSEGKTKPGKKGTSKGLFVLPIDDYQKRVPESIKVLVCRAFIRIRRAGYRRVLRAYWEAHEEYKFKVIDQEEAIMQDAQDGTHLADRTVLTPPLKPLPFIMASRREIGIMMQLGVALTFFERERVTAEQFGHELIAPPDVEEELLTRGVEEWVEKKYKIKKKGKTKGGEKGDKEKKGDKKDEKGDVSAKNLSKSMSKMSVSYSSKMLVPNKPSKSKSKAK